MLVVSADILDVSEFGYSDISDFISSDEGTEWALIGPGIPIGGIVVSSCILVGVEFMSSGLIGGIVVSSCSLVGDDSMFCRLLAFVITDEVDPDEDDIGFDLFIASGVRISF